MARKKKNRTSKLSYMAVIVVTAAVVCVLVVWTGTLKDRNSEYIERESRLSADLEQESLRNDELSRQYDYVKTDDYVEDYAKNHMGLINEGDMLVKPNE